jgi:hypothetical protein
MVYDVIAGPCKFAKMPAEGVPNLVKRIYNEFIATDRPFGS